MSGHPAAAGQSGAEESNQPTKDVPHNPGEAPRTGVNLEQVKTGGGQGGHREEAVRNLRNWLLRGILPRSKEASVGSNPNPKLNTFNLLQVQFLHPKSIQNQVQMQRQSPSSDNQVKPSARAFQRCPRSLLNRVSSSLRRRRPQGCRRGGRGGRSCAGRHHTSICRCSCATTYSVSHATIM